MASVAVDIRTLVLALVVLAVFVGAAYLLNPSYVGRLLGSREMRDSFVDGAKVQASNSSCSCLSFCAFIKASLASFFSFWD